VTKSTASIPTFVNSSHANSANRGTYPNPSKIKQHSKQVVNIFNTRQLGRGALNRIYSERLSCAAGAGTGERDVPLQIILQT